jgi:hypothetical protein
MENDIEIFMKKHKDANKLVDAEFEEMLKQEKTLKKERNQDSIDRIFSY